MSSENAGRKQGRFAKGQSGNPRGRPKGARNSATLACEALLEGQAEALTQKAIEKGLEGDPTALRLCMDRICPPRKDRPVTFPLPPINTSMDAANAMSAVMNAVAAGQITPADAAEVSKVIAVTIKAFETAEFADSKHGPDQLSDAELLRIAAGGTPPRLLTIGSR